jgi:hypothetical protein
MGLSWHGRLDAVSSKKHDNALESYKLSSASQLRIPRPLQCGLRLNWQESSSRANAVLVK